MRAGVHRIDAGRRRRAVNQCSAPLPIIFPELPGTASPIGRFSQQLSAAAGCRWSAPFRPAGRRFDSVKEQRRSVAV